MCCNPVANRLKQMKMAGAPCPSGLKGDPNTAQGKERSDAALGIALARDGTLKGCENHSHYPPFSHPFRVLNSPCQNPGRRSLRGLALGYVLAAIQAAGEGLPTCSLLVCHAIHRTLSQATA